MGAKLIFLPKEGQPPLPITGKNKETPFFGDGENFILIELRLTLPLFWIFTVWILVCPSKVLVKPPWILDIVKAAAEVDWGFT